MNPVFRLAIVEDLPALLALEQQCFTTDRLNRRSFRWMINRAHGQLLVVQCGEQLVGYALVLFHRRTSRARLYSIAIAVDARGSGLGQQLLKRVEACALEHGCAYLRLEVRIDNPMAIALYERNGYRRFALFHDYYQDHTDALRLEKPVIAVTSTQPCTTRHRPHRSTHTNTHPAPAAHRESVG
ncbi:ribosomal protein S18-alanine N-acetyltransferase [Pseudomonas frederiksbergensis]|nr:ribosomal protein S18-alanine N-acetyltransferase [Pseudomonas frederiksbergensis]